jgi:hypothetical protein
MVPFIVTVNVVMSVCLIAGEEKQLTAVSYVANVMNGWDETKQNDRT